MIGASPAPDGWVYGRRHDGVVVARSPTGWTYDLRRLVDRRLSVSRA